MFLVFRIVLAIALTIGTALSAIHILSGNYDSTWLPYQPAGWVFIALSTSTVFVSRSVLRELREKDF